MRDALIRAVHDATIDAAVARFVVGRRVVGVMGGHALARDAAFYRTVAVTGRMLTRAGFTVATGGGPGVMEAANLGAWMAPFDDAALDDALAVLADAPGYDADPDGYLRGALAVRARWPRGGVSLGVPTWVYVNEPTTAFATHLAKYFTNSIREDGLLAIARSGVVYAPGSAGTEEEIFTDTAQNSLTLYKVRSPMVFFGEEFFERRTCRARDRGPPAGDRVRVAGAVHGVRRARSGRGVHRRARSRCRRARRRRASPAPRRRLTMPAPVVHAPGDVTPFREAFARIRSEFEVPAAFPEAVIAEAAAVVARGPVTPDGAAPLAARSTRVTFPS